VCSRMLTVEDANTIIRKYGVEEFYHTLDTSCLPFDDDESFTDYECDFFRITKELVDGDWRWTFKIDNDYWVNQGYAFDENNNYLTNTSVTGTGTLGPRVQCSALNPKVTVGITVLGKPGYVRMKNKYLRGIPQRITLDQVGQFHDYRILWLDTGSDNYARMRINVGVFSMSDLTHIGTHFMIIRLLKTSFQYECTQTLTCGKVNKVLLGTSEDYKPGGILIQDNTPTINVEYKNQIIPVTWSETDNDYIFYLDLTQDYNPGKLNLNILVETNDVINESIDSITLLKEIETVTSFDRLKEEILAGTGLIHIGDNITFTSDLILNYDAKLLGNQHTLEMGGYKIQLQEDKTLILNDLTLNEGNPAIIQENNTTLELNRCTFTGNTSEDYNQLGSCIYCNTNIENLTITDDYTTNITDCLFEDNHSAIFHGGQLSINGSKFILSDSNFAEASNPAFLYQTDGEANITNNSFIIIQDNEEWCINEKNIGYAQCILICGETAIVNGADHTSLQKQNSLPFETNRTYLYAKYYYPRLEGCVVTSPLPGFEDKNCTYAVSGVDWVFKQNSQVTLPDQANNNQPNWEEW